MIDPRRDIDIYIELARECGRKITYIAETHHNEDYVIGSKALQEITDAKIVHGANLDFEHGESI